VGDADFQLTRAAAYIKTGAHHFDLRVTGMHHQRVFFIGRDVDVQLAMLQVNVAHLSREIDSQLGIGVDVQRAAIGQKYGFGPLGGSGHLLLIERHRRADIEGEDGT